MLCLRALIAGTGTVAMLAFWHSCLEPLGSFTHNMGLAWLVIWTFSFGMLLLFSPQPTCSCCQPRNRRDRIEE